MAQIGAVFVFCSSCKILYFASSVHPKNATVMGLVETRINSSFPRRLSVGAASFKLKDLPSKTQTKHALFFMKGNFACQNMFSCEKRATLKI